MAKQKNGKPEIFRIKKGKKVKYIPASHESVKEPGTYKKVLAVKSEIPEGLVQMVNLARIPFGKSFRPHFHEDMTEVFVIISGSGLIKIDNQSRKIESEDLIIIRPRQVHKIRNTGKEDLKYLVFGISKEGKGKTVLHQKRPLRRGV